MVRGEIRVVVRRGLDIFKSSSCLELSWEPVTRRGTRKSITNCIKPFDLFSCTIIERLDRLKHDKSNNRTVITVLSIRNKY